MSALAAPWNRVLSPPQRDGHASLRPNGISVSSRVEDDCGDWWHDYFRPLSPVGDRVSESFSSLRALGKYAHGAAGSMGVQALPIEPGQESRTRPRARVQGLEIGPDQSITRPIERPWSSSAGTIARGRHEVRRLGRTSLEQIETKWWTYRVLAGWQRRWIARPLVELRI